ncbi:hypothetical protein OAP83_02915, partial [Rickettsiales bacterium]|nr:hypothetical protein [Rickettsiales bacterium]
MGFQNIELLSKNFKESKKTNNYELTPGLHYLHPGYKILDSKGHVYNFPDQSDQEVEQAASQEPFCVTADEAPVVQDSEGFILNLKAQLDFIVSLEIINMDPETDYPKLAMLTRKFLFYHGDINITTLSSYAKLFTLKQNFKGKLVPNDSNAFNTLKKTLTLFISEQIEKDLVKHQETSDQSTGQVRDLKAEVEELRLSIEEGRAALLLKGEELTAIKVSRDEASRDLEQTKQELETVKEGRLKLAAQIEELTSHVVEHKQKHEDLNSSHLDLAGEKEHLERQVRDLNSVIDDLNSKLVESKEIIGANKQKLENQTGQIVQAAIDRQELNDSIVTLKQQVLAAESERESKIAELEKTSKTLSTFRRESTEFQSSNEKVLDQLRIELERKKESFSVLTETLDEVNAEKTELEAKLPQLEDALTVSKESLRVLQSQLEEKELYLQSNQDQLDSLKEDLDTKSKELLDAKSTAVSKEDEYQINIESLRDELIYYQSVAVRLEESLVQSQAKFKEEQLRSVTRQAQAVVSKTGSSVDDDIYVANLKAFHTSDAAQSMQDLLKSRYISVFNERYSELNDPKVLFDLYDQSLKDAFTEEFGESDIQKIEDEFDGIFTEE